MEEIEALRNRTVDVTCLQSGPECVIDVLESHALYVIAIFAVFGIMAVVILSYVLFVTDDDNIHVRKAPVVRRASNLDLDTEGGPHNTSVSGFTHASPISELTHHFHMRNLLHLDNFKQYARRLSHVALANLPPSRRGSSQPPPPPSSSSQPASSHSTSYQASTHDVYLNVPSTSY